MHVSDALISVPVAVAAMAAAAALVAVAVTKVGHGRRERLVPLMGVMGAFVFAAQMVNFAIPGTGSSGHVIGGVLLAAFLGPWAAFLVLTSVLIIQALVFADGGLMALGCNILNMAAAGCLVAYPLVFRPLIGHCRSKVRTLAVSVAACVLALELGACMVTAETCLSGVTALSSLRFFELMAVIHLAAGIIEGVATGLVVSFISRAEPGLLAQAGATSATNGRRSAAMAWLLVVALFIAGAVVYFASGAPDGLEWSVARAGGQPVACVGRLQASLAVMPDYEWRLSGVVGALATLAAVWGIGRLIVSRRGR